MQSDPLISSVSSAKKRSLPQADAYIFDIDGTLLVTRDLVHWNALHRAMVDVYGVDTTIEGIQYHGKTDLSILRAALEREGVQGRDFEAALPRALEVVCREVELNRNDIVPDVCPGILQLLDSLHAANKLLGVASGNLEAVGWHKIETAGLRGLFSFGYFSDQCEERSGIFRSAVGRVKEQLGSGARSLFIGDTPADIQAARDAGALIIAVSTGIFGFDELSACSPDLCVTHCGEFLLE
jgi:phosphoglycolate phosphatase